MTLSLAALCLPLMLGQTPATTDPFVRTAQEVLAGKWPCEEWKRQAYAAGLAQGVTVRGFAWRTSYYPWEGRSGRVDARGLPCTMRTAAANKLPRYCYVWIENPCQMRQVLDCGARYNDAVARRRGCDLWLDTWERRPCENTITRYAVIQP